MQAASPAGGHQGEDPLMWCDACQGTGTVDFPNCAGVCDIGDDKIDDHP